MPNCFTLTPKGETTPAKLADIDDEMCKHFGVEPSKHSYYDCWVDCEGLCLAMGRDWDYMRAAFPERRAIIDYLAERYVPNAWRER